MESTRSHTTSEAMTDSMKPIDSFRDHRQHRNLTPTHLRPYPVTASHALPACNSSSWAPAGVRLRCCGWHDYCTFYSTSVIPSSSSCREACEAIWFYTTNSLFQLSESSPCTVKQRIVRVVQPLKGNWGAATAGAGSTVRCCRANPTHNRIDNTSQT